MQQNKKSTCNCGIDCEMHYGEHSVVCPGCKTFIWHLHYLMDAFKERELEEPDFQTKTWGCPQCIPL